MKAYMEFFYGTDEQFVDNVLFPRHYNVKMKGKHIGRMCLENKRRAKDCKFRYKSLNAYKKKVNQSSNLGITQHPRVQVSPGAHMACRGRGVY